MLPTALARAIRLPLLTPEQFTPTKWDDAPTKAKFGNHLLRFIAEDFPETMFTQKFYQRLSNTFGHIACYDRHGFWSEFFISRATKLDFLDQTIRHPCYGDPAWTYSDVEQVIRARLKQSGVIDCHRRLLMQEREARERAEYERLARKFTPGPIDGNISNPADAKATACECFTADIMPDGQTSARPHVGSSGRTPIPASFDTQPDLFAGL
ncbi:hypothetical protein AruPA_18550 [Acidiphilium sp. PA]|uniref:hypothetical protein n=1 Tax=Acidiphilium sp. PA TaxID=2871705 RepID=UPI0022447515|nr:hypothetical protein [Acidiphilium sp. PA]MCW8309038.1 hypothetical protein [Acidiphilium sp. PA]